MELVGATCDPMSLFGTVGLRGAVDYTIVNSRVTVDHGQLVGIDEDAVAEEAQKACTAYLMKV